ncbi:hypothetical protein HK101_006935, partial [Irineochytrium annulatum]
MSSGPHRPLPTDDPDDDPTPAYPPPSAPFGRPSVTAAFRKSLSSAPRAPHHGDDEDGSEDDGEMSFFDYSNEYLIPLPSTIVPGSDD